MTLGVEGADVKACLQTCQLCTPVGVSDLCSHLSVHQSFHPTGILIHAIYFISSYIPLVGRNCKCTSENCNIENKLLTLINSMFISTP